MTLKIAFRNIFRQKRRTILTMISMIMGFFLGAFSISMTHGGFSNIIDAFARAHIGHIEVHKGDYVDRPSIYKTITDYESLMEDLHRKANIESMTPRVIVAGLLSSGEKTSGVKIYGIDPVLEDKATNFSNTVKEGMTLTTANNQALLGKGLAEQLGVSVGDTVVLISQAADGSMADALFPVLGIIDSGDEASDRATMMIHIQDAQRLFVLPDQVHEIAIMLPEIGPEMKLSQTLNKEYANKDLSFEPWQVIASVFYQSIQTKLDGSRFSTVLILLIIGVGVLNTVLMTVFERTKEYGVLRAIGTSPGGIVRMVLAEVYIMAILSIIIGSLIAVIVISILAVTGIDYGQTMDFGGISIRYLYPRLLPICFWLPSAVVLIMAGLAGIIPALRASKIQPAKALRSI